MTDVTPQDFGAVADGTTDDHDALQDWLNEGGLLRLPAGRYRCSSRLEVTKNVNIQGDGFSFDARQASLPEMPGSRIDFDAGTGGIIFYPQTMETNPDTVNSNPSLHFTQEGTIHSIIENVALYGGGGEIGDHGLETRMQVIVRNVMIQGFGGTGCYIQASSDTADPNSLYGNASLTVLEKVQCIQNGLHGFHIAGRDASVIKLDSCNAQENGAWGFLDQGMLGNCYVNCHAGTNNANHASSNSAIKASSNVNIGSFKATSAVAQHAYIGCYVEGWQGNGTSLTHECGVFGGTMALSGETNPDLPFKQFGSLAYGSGLSWVNGRGTGGTAVTVGPRPTQNQDGLLSFGADDSGADIYSGFQRDVELVFERGTKTYGFLSPGLPLSIQLEFLKGMTNARALAPAFFNGFFLGSNMGGAGGLGPRITHSKTASAPAGEYAVGDIVLTPAAAGGKIGLVCVTGGVVCTTAWTSGEHIYAIGGRAYGRPYRTNAGNVYRLTTLPTTYPATANAPTHSSGEAIGADGLGWTFVNPVSAAVFKAWGPIDA